MGGKYTLVLLFLCLKLNNKTMKTLQTLLLLFLISICVNGQDRKADSLVLVSIYNKLDGPNWVGADNWLSDKPIENWKGVKLVNDRVYKLNLNNFKVKGQFPVEVSKLDKLNTLEIKGGELIGGIPVEIQELKELSRLILDRDKLDGEIPNIFKNMDNLATLTLNTNNLTGTLPDLPENLTLFYAQNNKLSGAIPESWRNHKLEALILERNNLTGSFDIISTFPNLFSLDLDRNDWTASIFPTWIDDVPKLHRFSCEYCNLYGELPNDLDFSNLEEYYGMFISGNKLSGDISLLFNNGDYGKKMYLVARNNEFSGKVPIDKIKSFFSFQVNDNQYSSLSKLSKDALIGSCDISGNNLNFEALEPIRNLIEADSVFTYNKQNDLLTKDTIIISTATVIKIEAGDNHPNTKYKWMKNNGVLSENSSELSIDIQDNSSSGTYMCVLTNDIFPLLKIRRNSVVVKVDISTGTKQSDIDELVVFPNPTNGILNLKGLDRTVSNQYTISSINGNIVKFGALKSSDNLDVGGLDSGIYILSIGDTIKQRKIKIIKF